MSSQLFCKRCGQPRTAKPGPNRTGYCQDCAAGKSDTGRVNRDWIDDAACTQVDPELFFPSTEDNWQPTRDAKRICAGCPVAAQCLADTPAWDRWSVRGGTTGTERRGRNAA